MFYKTLAMIICLSLKSFTVYFSMELLIGYQKNFPLEMWGGVQIGKSAYAMGVVACVRVRTMGVGSQIFVILVRTY